MPNSQDNAERTTSRAVSSLHFWMNLADDCEAGSGSEAYCLRNARIWAKQIFCKESSNG